jgi:hypothetical protein
MIPADISGWMVFAGMSAEDATLQTATPLAAGAAWTEPDTGLRTDLSAWPVQGPDLYLENRRELLRG